MKKYILLLMPLFLCACNSSTDAPSSPIDSGVVTVTTEFKDGSNGWVAGFSDYPIADESIYQFETEIESIPSTQDNVGFLLGGVNHSADLFMYLKRRVSGLAPNTRYTLTIEATLWSNAGSDCVGNGGHPGESVFVKAGASELEPTQVDYYLNTNAGSQSQDGNDARILGNIAIDNIACSGVTYKDKTLTLTTEMAFEVISSSDGHLWVLLGTDSGFEGLTQLYYESIDVTFTPQ